MLPTVRSVGPDLASIHQMAPPNRGRTHLMIALLLIYRPRKDERLSCLVSWSVADGLRFTHIVVTRRAERRTGSVRRPKTGVLPTVLLLLLVCVHGLLVLDSCVHHSKLYLTVTLPMSDMGHLLCCTSSNEHNGTICTWLLLYVEWHGLLVVLYFD